jgi:hypothetical protein
VTEDVDPTSEKETGPDPDPLAAESAASASDDRVSPAIRATLLELMKYGLLESVNKPNLYRAAVLYRVELDEILRWMELRLRIDDIRGLAFLIADLPEGADDEWAHPLIRRQRLTLEQSLLVALLRQHYVAHEIESGIGAADAHMALDDLIPHLQAFLGDPGSDAQERKRLLTLLEQLKAHGLVSDVDQYERVTIRPIIVHLANPENLGQLIRTFRAVADAQSDAASEPEATPP